MKCDVSNVVVLMAGLINRICTKSIAWPCVRVYFKSDIDKDKPITIANQLQMGGGGRETHPETVILSLND